MSSDNIVEDYGVKVSFDNQEFNENIEQSEEKLDGFKNTVSSVADSVRNISFGGIDLGDLLNFAALQTGFYTIRQEIESLADPIETLAERALNVATQTIQSIIQQIEQGGKTRALNIERAKFQIEGLKLDVDTFMEAADYAVSGTAYSLDQAAKVASQLGASGITQLDELKSILRSISGLASMTNSEFQDIGRIYTFAASYGRITSRQLMMLSSRGINAAATLAKEMGKTEAEVRDLMSKGKISFLEFAKAMDSAFGEHAKDANKTFDGAMRNIRAALSRLGEAFQTPIIQNSIQVFNEIRLSVNALKTELQDNFVFEQFSSMITVIYGNIKKLFEEFRYGLGQTKLLEEISYLAKDIMQIMKEMSSVIMKIEWGEFAQIANAVTVIVEKVKQLINALKEAFDEVFGIRQTLAKFESVTEWAFSLLEAFQGINDLEVKEVFKNWFETLKGILLTIKDVLGISFETRKAIKDMFSGAIEKAMEFFHSLQFSEETADKLRRIFSGAASIVVLIKQMATSVYGFVKPVIGGIIKLVEKLGDKILSVLAYVGDFFTWLAKAEKEQNAFENFFKTITRYFESIIEFFKKIGTAFSDTFLNGISSKGGSTTFIDKIFEFIQKVGEIAGAVLDNFTFNLDLSPIQAFIKNLGNFGFSDEEIKSAEKAFDTSKSLLANIVEFISNIWHTLFSKEGKDATSAESSIKKTSKFSEVLQNILEWIKSLIETIIQNTDPALLTAGVLGGTAMMIDATAGLLKVLFDGIIGIMEIILAFTTKKAVEQFLNRITIIPDFEKKIDKALSIIGKVSDTVIPNMVKTLKSAMVDFKPLAGLPFGSSIFKRTTLEQITDLISTLGWFMLKITASLFLIALIPVSDLWKAAGALAAMGLLLGVIVGGLSLLTKFIQPIENMYKNPITSMGRAMDLMAVSLLIIAEALKVAVRAINEVPEGESVVPVILSMVAMVGTIAVALAGLLLFIKYFDMSSTQVLKVAGGFALMGLAVAEIAAALSMLSMTIKSDTDIAKLWWVVGALSVMTAVVGAIIGFLVKILGDNALMALAIGGGMMLMFAGLGKVISAVSGLILALSVMDVEKIDKVGEILNNLLWALGLFISVLSIIAVAGGLLGEMGSLGLLAAAVLVVSFVALITSLSAPIMALMLMLDSLSRVLEAFKELVIFIKNLSEEDAENIGNNIGKIIEQITSSIPPAIGATIEAAIDEIERLNPKISDFFKSTLTPFLATLIDELSTPLTEKVLKTIEKVLTKLNEHTSALLGILYQIIFGNGNLLDNVLVWLNELWDRTVDWMKKRIPIWVDDVAELLLILIRSINDALEGKWDEFDEELKRLMKNTIELIKDVLTGKQTLDDVRSLIEVIIQNFADGISDNAYLIKDAFKDMANEAVAGFFEGLTDGFTDSGFSIDLSGGFQGIKDWFSGGLDTSGVFGGNNLPYNNNMNRDNYLDNMFDRFNEMMTGNKSDVNVNINTTLDEHKLINYEYNYNKRLNRAGWNRG